MPRVRFAAFIEGIDGTLNGMVFKRSPKGNTIVTRCPDMSNVEWSDAQNNQRSRFSLANDYAKAAMADSRVRAVYEELAAQENRKPYRVAFLDYFKGNNLLAGPIPSGKNQQ